MTFHNRNLRILSLLVLVTTLFAACQPSGQENTSQQKSTRVTVSILPQAYFVERITGGTVTINVMVGPGEEAHTYEPKPEQMKFLTQSQIFLTIGLEYESVWLPRFEAANPDLLFIDSSEGIQRIPLATDHTDHDEEEDHQDDATQGLDPHVWLSPKNGRIIAENTLLALVDLLPESAEVFQENYETLIADIAHVDARITSTLDGMEHRQFMVFHPAWGYFADQYDLEQLPVQVGGQDPSASELASLIKIAQDEKIRVIFIQPTFNTASVDAIAQEIDAEVAVVDPLAQDWLSNLEAAADAFASALADQN